MLFAPSSGCIYSAHALWSRARASGQYGDAVEDGTETAAEVVSAVVQLGFEYGQRGTGPVRLPGAPTQPVPVPGVRYDGRRARSPSAPAGEPVQRQSAVEGQRRALAHDAGALVLHVFLLVC